MVASQKCEVAQHSVIIWTYSSSRSSKVIDFGTNRKCIYDFLLVINSNFGPILHRYWDTATYWLKIACFSYPSLIWRPRSLSSPWNFWVKLTVRKLRVMGLPGDESCMILTSSVFDWITRVTDGQTGRRTDRRTDGRAIAYTLYSIYAVARKKLKATSFQFPWGKNSQQCSSSQLYWLEDLLRNRLTESDFRFDVTLSRWRPWRDFTQRSTATWWVNTKRRPRAYAAAYTSSWSIVRSYLLDQELIPYRYVTPLVAVAVAVATLLKKSLRLCRSISDIRIKFGRTVHHVNTHRLAESYFPFDVTLSRCRRRRRFMS